MKPIFLRRQDTQKSIQKNEYHMCFLTFAVRITSNLGSKCERALMKPIFQNRMTKASVGNVGFG